MPEAPELRTDADDLCFYLSDRILLSLKVIGIAFAKKCHGLDKLQEALPLTIDRVRSRGKKLLIFMKPHDSSQPPWTLIFGYGMTGNISQVKQKHSHILFKMSDNWIGFNTWYYSDARRMGSVEATNEPDQMDKYLSDIAKPIALGYDEPNLGVIDRDEFSENIQECGNSYLASKLMDQRSICSGVGNYILSEVFYAARLDPVVRCSNLSSSQIKALWKALHSVILSSYKHRGVSMIDYVNANGDNGTHQDYLQIYGKKGKKTPSGHLIQSCRGPHGRTIFFTDENKIDDK